MHNPLNNWNMSSAASSCGSIIVTCLGLRATKPHQWIGMYCFFSPFLSNFVMFQMTCLFNFAPNCDWISRSGAGWRPFIPVAFSGGPAAAGLLCSTISLIKEAVWLLLLLRMFWASKFRQPCSSQSTAPQADPVVAFALRASVGAWAAACQPVWWPGSCLSVAPLPNCCLHIVAACLPIGCCHASAQPTALEQALHSCPCQMGPRWAGPHLHLD